MSELGATEWAYMTEKSDWQKGIAIGPKGLYWTTEDINSYTYTRDANNKNGNNSGFSQEYVLSYYYNSTDNKYEVIANPVWMNQADLGGKAALSAKSDWEKGNTNWNDNHKDYDANAIVIGSADTYAEAQKIYADAKTANGGSFVYTNRNSVPQTN